MDLRVTTESWPLAQAFRISRGAKTSADVVVASVSDGTHVGRGECVPYKRYGESIEGVVAAIEALAPHVADGLDPIALQGVMTPGAARNALDCALWDLAAKRAGKRIWELLNQPAPEPAMTAYTLSLDTPEAMAAAARAARDRPLLKLKLGGDGDIERVRAVREETQAALIVDANEAWSPAQVEAFTPAMAEAGVVLIEQPLPADDDAALEAIESPVLLCADESLHDRHDLDRIARRYDVINVKLDKTGGLTEALALVKAAQERDLGLMVGCMVGTSLAMAPAMLVAVHARWVDLDGPLLLAADRQPGLAFEGSIIQPPPAALWG
ncbi:N-acetyl-D-Glu racemase DgcA [Zavarzinia sp. CC-PAN008]|uniref:N-acetyl-D-Glu racemase DgcA n=1 Tax=Zavarzinia sp. CC-PAN008 TaxID=3243332 RepID=UPI003F74A033